MKRSTKSFTKTASNLYQSIHQQLNVYAGAAVVAVMSMLALTQPSEAKIVYTSANVVIENSTYNLDLNNDGIVDFRIPEGNSDNGGCQQKGGIFVFLGATAMPGNGIVGSTGLPIVGFPPPPAAALSTGAPIGPKRMYLGMSTMAFREHGWFFIFPPGICEQVDINEGNWLGTTNRYLGLKFQIDGKTHYGWARLSTQVFGNGFLAATLTGYAYETIAGKSIKAGQKKEAVDEAGEEDFGLKAEDAETLGGKPVADFVLRDPDIPGGDAAETSSPGFCSPQNCLIRRCLVGSGNRLTGVCLEGARGGVCRSGGGDPTHCPPGAKPKSPVSKQCGPLKLLVDASRPCL
jgi:hypothetical protein